MSEQDNDLHDFLHSVVENVIKQGARIQERATTIRKDVSAFFKARYPDADDFEIMVLMRSSTTLLAIITIMRPEDVDAPPSAAGEAHTIRTMMLCRALSSFSMNIFKQHGVPDEKIAEYLSALEATVDDVYDIIDASQKEQSDNVH